MNFIRDFLSELDDPMPLPHWLQWSAVPIAQAFIFSIMLHLVFIIGWECAFQVGMVRSRPSALLKEMLVPADANSDLSQTQEQEQEMPLVFVEVDPLQEVEPPPDTKYYSSANTVAGNPEPVVEDKQQTKVEGVEQDVMRTENVTRTEPEEMVPVQEDSAQKTEQEPEPEISPKPMFAARPSDLGVGKAEEKPRPRTLREAKKNVNLVGNATKQEGGVRRHSLIAQLDVRGTPFGNYDAAFIAAVQKRWYDVLSQSGVVTGPGKVVIVFKLHSDGRITDLEEISSTVSSLQSLLCQRAILDPAPYSPWPSELRRAVQGDVREVKFTFYYN